MNNNSEVPSKMATRIRVRYVLSYKKLIRIPIGLTNDTIAEAMVNHLLSFGYKKVMAYGAGELFMEFSRKAIISNIEIQSIILSTPPDEQQTTKNGINIYSIDHIKIPANMPVVLCSTIFHNEMRESLIAKEIPQEQIIDYCIALTDC